ncbi:hypothetical protein PAXRUDRAFT_615928 [Paxillus rubicundulus Ve08.2h10]|uniref:Uncharacterized protein n=1 Tax=Paxillus rubicundulus Ve08.2h10 TaxID=930991 RepID=A0A0D0E3N8_9AGAM|nr:hypothetical protein PAXRUDRAFT_615928 [Paxillus rubicundulus Ve08.2h10]
MRCEPSSSCLLPLAEFTLTLLDTFKIELSLPDARYEKNKKKITISVDGKVEWTHKWTKPETFAPPFEGRDLSHSSANIVFVTIC